MKQAVSVIQNMWKDKTFLNKAAMIALPVALQGLMNNLVNLIDTMMIGRLGATSIAAVGLANKVFFVFSLLVFGVVSGCGVLAAQFWGSQDVKNIRKVLGIGLSIAGGGSLFFLVPSVIRPDLVMRIFTTSEGSIAIGASYLAIVAFSYPFNAISTTYVAMLRSVGIVKAPVAISSCTIVTNVVLNYILIFGHFGVPALGVVGAAIATLIARVVECTLVLVITYKGRNPFACHISKLFGCSRAFFMKFLQTASPVIANEFLWGLGVTMYSLAYGRMGDDAVAAITIAGTIQDLVIVSFQGISAATAVVLGNAMGAGKLKRAEEYATNFFVLEFLVSLVCMSLIVIFRWYFIGLYNITPEVAHNVSVLLLVFVCYMPAKDFNFVNIVGVMRSGGDTKFCLFLDCSGVWLIGVPMAFLGGLVFHLPITIVYAMVMFEEIYKAALGFYRYRQKKWLRNLAAEIQS